MKNSSLNTCINLTHIIFEIHFLSSKSTLEANECEELGYLPFTRENRKFQLENQMVRAIPFGKLQKIWAVI